MTPDFTFVIGGRRLSFADVRALIDSMAPTELDITLSNATARASGGVGYLLVDDRASFKSAGVAVTAVEVGLIVFRRSADGWRMAAWMVSPSPSPTAS